MGPRAGRALAALVLLACLTMVPASSAQTPQSQPPLPFSQYASIGSPTRNRQINALYSVRCPSSDLCIAADNQDNGGLIKVAYGGVGAGDHVKWQKVHSATSGRNRSYYGHFNCRSLSVCLLDGSFSHDFESPHPRDRATILALQSADARTWRVARLPGGDDWTVGDLSCSSGGRCVAVGLRNGNLHPEVRLWIADGDYARSSSWRRAPSGLPRLGGDSGAFDLECPSRSFCMVKYPNRIMVGRGVGTKRPRWTARRIPGIDGDVSVRLTCPSPAFCAALVFRRTHSVLSAAADPSNLDRWHNISGQTDGVRDISCASATFCMAVGGKDYYGFDYTAWYTTSPTDALAAWTSTTWMAGISDPGEVYCDRPRECTLAGLNNLVVASDAVPIAESVNLRPPDEGGEG